MTGVPAAYFWILAGLVAALLVAEYRRSPAGLWATKPLAAAVYIAIAVAAGATESAYGWAILAALALSWWGDVLLIPKDRPGVFRAGILAFLAGHLAFAVAFVIRGVSPGALVIALGLMAIPAVTIHAWLAGELIQIGSSAIRWPEVVALSALAQPLATSRRKTANQPFGSVQPSTF